MPEFVREEVIVPLAMWLAVIVRTVQMCRCKSECVEDWPSAVASVVMTITLVKSAHWVSYEFYYTHMRAGQISWLAFLAWIFAAYLPDALQKSPQKSHD